MANSGNPSRRCVKRLGWLALLVAVLAIAGLVVNVVDYRRYYRAAHFEESEGLDKVKELARACFELGKNGHVILTEYPANIARLRPHWVSMDRDYAQIGLYGHLDASVFLVFEKYGGNEVVTVCDYVDGITDDRPILVQNQAAYDFLHPKERIVTLAQATMHEYVEWIVLANEVRVIAHAGSGGLQVVGQRPISGEERQAVEAAAKAIPASVRGRHFQSGVIDGIHLRILFEAEGRRGPADIELDNTWREEATPLVKLVERFSPKERPLKFRTAVERELKEYPREQSSITWPEEAKLQRPPMPWWCIWPRFERLKR